MDFKLEEIRKFCPAGLELVMQEDRLTLTNGSLSLAGDFREILPRLRQKNLEREFLVKAAKPQQFQDRPILLDATAGLGEDSMILAAAGFRVILYEYNPVIAALLQNTIDRALQEPELTDAASRMELYNGDSISAMRKMAENGTGPDVILLDPMFPARTKSALVKKKFQLLQRLEQPCTDETELLEAAVAAHPKKILIKRPLKGPNLAGCKPSYTITGKAIRYDCLVYA